MDMKNAKQTIEKTLENPEVNKDWENIKTKLGETKDALTDAAYDVKNKAGEILSKSMSDIKEKSSDMQEKLIQYIKEKPMTSVLIAAGAGLLLSLFLRKKD